MGRVNELRQSQAFQGPGEAAGDHGHAIDHFALIYESREEQFDAAIPFLRRGLERNEQCLYIADESTEAELLAAMRARGVDVDDALASGVLSILSPAATYRRTGEFDPDAMLDFLEASLEQAVDVDGYTGIRATGEMTWALDGGPTPDELAEYEALLNPLADGENCVILCQYNLKRFPPEVIYNVIRTHPYLVHAGRVYPNDYYTPPEEFFGPDRPEREVERMLGSLRAQTDARERLKERERELQKSERRYRTLVENFPNGAVTLYDENLRYITVGGENIRKLDLPVEEIEGGRLQEVLPDDLASEIVPHYRAAIEEGERQTFEVEFAGRRYLFYALPVRDEAGEIMAGMGMSQDITDRKRRQQEHQRVVEALEAAREGISLLNDDGVFIYVNDAYADTFGYDSGEMIGEHWDDLGIEADPEYVYDEILPTLEREGQWTGTTTCVRSDASTFPAQHLLTQTEDDELICVLRDVTERKEREQDLELFKRLIDQSSDAIFVIDPDTSRFLDVNDTACRRLGYDRAELLELSVIDVARHLSDLDDWRSHVEGIAAEGGKTMEGIHERKNGTTFPVEVNATFIELDREYMVGIARDVTERKEYEWELEAIINRLQQSNDRLKQFAHAASHDLQEPLRMVSTYLQLLENRHKDDLDDDAREFIDFAVTEADRMREMVGDLLEYARVEQDEQKFEPVDCNAILAQVIENFEAQIEDTDAEIVTDTLPPVLADSEQLEQLLQNLVSNALKYRSDEPPRIDISGERWDDYCVFAVSDNGIGIEPGQTDRIFEIFKRLHHADDYPGTGIGLSLCQEIVENHGGEIWVESEPGEGSTFFFTLPAAASDGV